MIAADTSTWVAFLEGEEGDDTRLLEEGLRDRNVVMVPAVLTELLSDPQLEPEIPELLSGVPMADTKAGYWQRAGRLRALVLSKGRKARLGDALIAQSCVDDGVLLIARDLDFRVFIETTGLQLVIR